MKYRLMELLRCPSHPGAMLRAVDVQVSEFFPYARELRIPVCRTGCGYLGNWFQDIPESLPPPHSLDCRRCLGLEIETASLICPVCNRRIEISDGVLTPACGRADETADESPISSSLGSAVDSLLDLESGEIVLSLARLPDASLRSWRSRGVERLQVELSSEELVSCRAASCANDTVTDHYLKGPIDPELLRPGSLDAIVMLFPPKRLGGSPGAIACVPSLLRRSGRAVFLYPREISGRHPGCRRAEDLSETLPASFALLEKKLFETPGMDVLLMSHGESHEHDGVHKHAIDK